jgi:hypothetical protein
MHRPAGHVEGPHTRLGDRRVHVLRTDPRDEPIAARDLRMRDDFRGRRAS